ncbi:MAG: fibronectin type III domain-containing protein [Butyricicoccus pullicaecorum]|nr:fibronectin type III domain-containing protein [Butyricicoccus pullicaecorum]
MNGSLTVSPNSFRGSSNPTKVTVTFTWSDLYLGGDSSPNSCDYRVLRTSGEVIIPYRSFSVNGIRESGTAKQVIEIPGNIYGDLEIEVGFYYYYGIVPGYDKGKVSTTIKSLANIPPNIPTSINLPSTIKGGSSCSISWSAATDPDGNLEGYIVERSYNGGSSWSQIYQGSATSTSTTIPHGTGTVMFRVCAYDTDGEKSGWRTSSNKTVLNNRAPSAPPSINVPVTPCGGETITITWSAASDPDGNLEGYRLERQWDGKGGFDQIYQGAGLSYTDTIPKGEHTSVTYRVRAYDSFGETSGYTTSPVRTVDNNLAPVIQCDLSGNLGDKSEGFVVPYTVTDAENHAVTVTERVGNLVKRTYSVTLGQSNSFQITGDYFQKILNGEQAAEIIATDTEGKSSTLSLTFTKKVHRASIMLSEPLTVDKPITVCVIKVVGNIPEDAEFKVEVANNVGDDLPAWEDATDAAKRGINHVFKNKTQTAGWKFGFRVTAARGASDTAGYITSIQGGFQ